MSRTRFSIIIVVLIIALAVGIFAFIPSPSKATVQDISVNRPQFIVHGKNLSRVEIWGIPTGTGVTEADYQMIGTSTLETTAPDGTETWVAAIPAEPLLVTNIFAKGYDAQGTLAGNVSLPQTGATDLFNALWAKNSDLVIHVGDTGSFAGISITLNAVVQDNRCPIDVVCIEAGAITANVTIKSSGREETRNMPSDEVPFEWSGYKISITNIDPPRESKREIDPNSYVITFHVES